MLQDRPRRQAPPGSPAALLRALVVLALGPVLAVAAVLTAVVLVLAVAGDAALAGVPAVVASLWLAAHGATLDVDGTRLGVLPLVPVLGLVLLTWRSVVGFAIPRGAGAGAGASTVRGRAALPVLGAAVAGPLLVGVLAVVVLATGAGGLPVAPASVVGTLVQVVGVHLLGAVLGLVRPSGTWVRVRRALPRWARTGLAQVPVVGLALLGAGGLLVLVALVLSAGTFGRLVHSGGGVAGGAGLVLLSLAYLPNAVVGAVSVLVGPGAVVGHATVTPFGAVGAPVPPLPLLAALPEGSGSWWWPVLLVVPAAVAVVLGLRCSRSGLGRDDALRAVGVTAVALGLLVAVLGRQAGGALGGGAFTPVGVPVLALATATVGWFAVLGCAAVLVDTQLRDAALAVASVAGAPVVVAPVVVAPVAGASATEPGAAEPDTTEPDTTEPPEGIDAPDTAPTGQH